MTPTLHPDFSKLPKLQGFLGTSHKFGTTPYTVLSTNLPECLPCTDIVDNIRLLSQTPPFSKTHAPLGEKLCKGCYLFPSKQLPKASPSTFTVHLGAPNAPDCGTLSHHSLQALVCMSRGHAGVPNQGQDHIRQWQLQLLTGYRAIHQECTPKPVKSSIWCWNYKAKDCGNLYCKPNKVDFVCSQAPTSCHLA